MDREHIKTAGFMLRLKTQSNEMVFPHQLDESKSLQIVLEAAKNYLNSATTYSDTCVTLARSCLSLIQDGANEDVRRELNLIESLPILYKFGIQMLPVQGKRQVTEDTGSRMGSVFSIRARMLRMSLELMRQIF